MTHEIRIVTATGPGGTNSYATCACDWWGRIRFTREQASTDGRDHLKSCLEALLLDALHDTEGIA